MTLKDKFDNPIMRHDLGRNEIEETKEQCVEIAEDFAINFANWYEFTLRESDNLNERFTPKQLIEMFKKEKEL